MTTPPRLLAGKSSPGGAQVLCPNTFGRNSTAALSTSVRLHLKSAAEVFKEWGPLQLAIRTPHLQMCHFIPEKSRYISVN